VVLIFELVENLKTFLTLNDFHLEGRKKKPTEFASRGRSTSSLLTG
jgi:hypothetical protein